MAIQTEKLSCASCNDAPRLPVARANRLLSPCRFGLAHARQARPGQRGVGEPERER